VARQIRIALQQVMRERGYAGSVFASYGSTPGDLPTVSVNVDLYATADGAHAAASTTTYRRCRCYRRTYAGGRRDGRVPRRLVATGATVLLAPRPESSSPYGMLDVPVRIGSKPSLPSPSKSDRRAQQG